MNVSRDLKFEIEIVLSPSNIVIEIKKVARANFRGEVEDFKNFAPRVITIPLN